MQGKNLYKGLTVMLGLYLNRLDEENISQDINLSPKKLSEKMKLFDLKIYNKIVKVFF